MGKRIEQLANNFAATLLMPSTSLNILIDAHRQDDITPLAKSRRYFALCQWRWHGDCSSSSTTIPVAGSLRRNRAHWCPAHPNVSPLLRAHVLHEALENGRLSAHKAAKAMGLG